MSDDADYCTGCGTRVARATGDGRPGVLDLAELDAPPAAGDDVLDLADLDSSPVGHGGPRGVLDLADLEAAPPDPAGRAPEPRTGSWSQFCHRCGTLYDDSPRYCRECGVALRH